MDGLERKVTMDESTTTTQNTQNESGATSTEQANTNSATTTTEPQGAQIESQTDIEKLIQKAVDRATNKLGNENKKLREENESLKKASMTEEQIKQLEIKNKEADIADREAKLKEKENRLFAIKAIKEAGLDDGGSNALELVDFVMTDSEETTNARVKAFNALVKKFVSAEVSRTFQTNGRDPEKGSTGETQSNNIAVNLGKNAADRNAAANYGQARHISF